MICLGYLVWTCAQQSSGRPGATLPHIYGTREWWQFSASHSVSYVAPEKGFFLSAQSGWWMMCNWRICCAPCNRILVHVPHKSICSLILLSELPETSKLNLCQNVILGQCLAWTTSAMLAEDEQNWAKIKAVLERMCQVLLKRMILPALLTKCPGGTSIAWDCCEIESWEVVSLIRGVVAASNHSKRLLIYLGRFLVWNSGIFAMLPVSYRAIFFWHPLLQYNKSNKVCLRFLPLSGYLPLWWIFHRKEFAAGHRSLL